MNIDAPLRGRRWRRATRTAALALAALLSVVAIGSAQAQSGGGSPAVDPAAPWTPKVTALVNALTLDEKISLVHGSPDPAPLGQAGYTSAVPRLGIPPQEPAASTRLDRP